MNKFTGIALAVGAAAMFTLAPVMTANAHGKAVQCMGANACKGKGSCKTANNACKGQNACKGKGVVMKSAKGCKKAGGTVMDQAAPAASDSSAPTTAPAQ